MIKSVSVKIEKAESKSEEMKRIMPYHVILPSDYENSAVNFPVLYLLHGLFGRFDNWLTNTGLADYASKYDLIIVTPEGGDGWYTDSLNNGSDKYESYFIRELIPEIESRYCVIKERSGRAVAGLSMGGYGALKFGVKYPQLFALAISMSGAFDPATRTDDKPGVDWESFKPSIMQVFGEKDSNVRKENDLHELFEELHDQKIKSLPFIYFDCGLEDTFIKTNKDLSEIFVRKGIEHQFLQLPGAHDWEYWDWRVRHVLQLTDEFLK